MLSEVRGVTCDDAGRIAAIYNYFIEHTVVTFEETPVSEAAMRARIEQVTAGFPWFVYERDHSVCAYAYASFWRSRSAYRFTVESTVYVSHDALEAGIGTQLYGCLLDELRKRKFHAVLAGITLPNDRSVRFHEKHGFVKAAHLSEVGYKHGKWIDVGYWILHLT